MTPKDRPLWPARARGPWLRLGFGLVAAPLTLAALMTLLSFAVYLATEAEFDAAFQLAGRAAAAFLVHLLTFTVSLGLAGVAGLWALGWRGAMAWAATGAVSGVLYALATGAASGAGVSPLTAVVAAVLSAALLILVRGFAGIRSG